MVTAAKTISQVAMHMSVAFAVMYAFTGSLALGGVAAVVPLHDKLWDRIRARVEARQQSKVDVSTVSTSSSAVRV